MNLDAASMGMQGSANAMVFSILNLAGVQQSSSYVWQLSLSNSVDSYMVQPPCFLLSVVWCGAGWWRAVPSVGGGVGELLPVGD